MAFADGNFLLAIHLPDSVTDRLLSKGRVMCKKTSPILNGLVFLFIASSLLFYFEAFFSASRICFWMGSRSQRL